MNLSEYFGHWKQVRGELLETIDKFEDDELLFVPYEGAWPVAKVMLHIADAERGWFRHVVRRETEEWPPQSKLEDYPSREAIKALLTEVHDDTEAYLESLDFDERKTLIEAPWGPMITLGWIVWHVLEHEIHHRGELSLMLGMLGREGLDV
ncbi:MAG: DinB family protein [Anaerolineae bacterium]|jgi:uncharacterized damage-inducible protein DinB